jgi:RNA polymerase sigma-70 factor (ECF subfamily)
MTDPSTRPRSISGDQDLAVWAAAIGGSPSSEADSSIRERWLTRTEALVERLRAPREEYPVDLGTFFSRLGSLLPVGDEREQAVAELCIEDLYLAHASSMHEPRAVLALRQEIEPELQAALGRLRIPTEQHDDLRQRLWEKLLIGTDRPKILDYSGRGRLRSWFRVTAIRFLLDELRRQKGGAARRSDENTDEIASPSADPELELLKRRYSREFTEAFEQATLALAPEDRNVLRSYYAKQMTIDEIAKAFGIHRATAARRVARARQVLLTDTRRRLAERLRLTNTELDSVLRLIESRMQVSVNRLLG